MAISSNLPEFRALAELAGVDPVKMAEAFNEPTQFFQHLTLEDLKKLNACFGRFALIQTQMAGAFDAYQAFTKGYLAAKAEVKSA